MPYNSNCVVCCRPVEKFDNLTVINGLRVLRGPNTLGGTTTADKICFRNHGSESIQWCAAETANDKLCVTESGSGAGMCLLPESGAVDTSGYFADGVEVLTLTTSTVPLNPSLLLGSTYFVGAPLSVGLGTLANGLFDGQIKRIALLETSTRLYGLFIPSFLDPILPNTMTFGTGFKFYSENFDGVVAPALPAGWTANNFVGGSPVWVTSTTAPDTAPNDAFIADPVGQSDKRLVSPTIPVPTEVNTSGFSIQLQFRNNFVFDQNFDGGVLEVSVNGNAFVDVLDPSVGGVFLAGGYNGALNGLENNPLGIRPAWVFSSDGYITTILQFPPALSSTATSLQFRFRMGSGDFFSAMGWRVDTITLGLPAGTLQSVVLQWIEALGKWIVLSTI